MYRLIANPNYIKSKNAQNENYENNIYLLNSCIKQSKYKIKLDDIENILNLIEDYYLQKTVEEIISNIINECISLHSDKT
jgi:hypothetical protein